MHRVSAIDRDVDVVVVGLGVLGASALRELAAGGVRVLGIDQFVPGHAHGSSHGRSRAVRYLYHAPEYVALLRPAIEGWRELQSAAGRQLYWPCGTLFFARPGNALMDQNLAIAEAEGVPFERLEEAEVTRRFPAFALTPGAGAVFSADGGMVDADATVESLLALALRHGAEILGATPVRAIDLEGDRPIVRTDTESVRARHVVVAAGAWTNRLLPDLALPMRVTRQTFFTMRAANPGAVGPDRVPVWADYDRMFYGFPDHGPGLKIGDDKPGPEVDPSAVERTIDPTEQARLTTYLAERFPTSTLDLVETGTCLYALLPDEDFVLGPVPGAAATVVVGLNHAFKFAPVIGRILADLATTGRTNHPIERFAVNRFAALRRT